ncbi:hypothetical protein SLS55_005499 [Diplodia seriata]|uniref:F-box domain-containing protein n=1 Tax=Diplodia seriata TaxID=420778 RepID=A0ABR3CGT5_9PEZI
MDRLPPELIALIISFLNEDGNDNDTTTTNLAAYAPISRQYQVAVEHLTFRRLRVQSGAEQLALFAERLLPRHRRAALAEIAFEVLLPAYSADRAAKFERRREREANNAAFTEAVAALFRVLRGWEEEGEELGKAGSGRGRGIALHLGAYAVADVERPRALDEWRDLGAHRYGKSVLRLLDGEDGELMMQIPEVRRIVEFRTPGRSRCTRQLRAASVARIAVAGMPNLGRVEWELDDCAFAEDEVRHRYRKDFADALSAVASGRLTDFCLRLRLDDPQNDAFSVPSGTDPAAGVDALSVALHDWLSAAPKLVSFTLDMSLSPSIFGPDAALSPSSPSPSPSSSSSQQPPPIKYPHLRTARITTGRTTAAGTWLYSADADDAQAVAAADAEEWEWHDPYDQSGYSSSACMTSWSSEELVDPDDSDWAETWHDWHDGLATGRRPRRHFRSRVDRGLLEGFLGAASRAVMVREKGDMPRLERMVVQVGEEVGGDWQFGQGEAQERQIYWECGVDDQLDTGDGDGDGGSGGMKKKERKGKGKVVRVVTLPGAWNEDPRWKPSKELREMWEGWVGEEGRVEVSLCEDNF